jgi:hypothetical protein
MKPLLGFEWLESSFNVLPPFATLNTIYMQVVVGGLGRRMFEFQIWAGLAGFLSAAAAAFECEEQYFHIQRGSAVASSNTNQPFAIWWVGSSF